MQMKHNIQLSLKQMLIRRILLSFSCKRKDARTSRNLISISEHIMVSVSIKVSVISWCRDMSCHVEKWGCASVKIWAVYDVWSRYCGGLITKCFLASTFNSALDMRWALQMVIASSQGGCIIGSHGCCILLARASLLLIILSPPPPPSYCADCKLLTLAKIYLKPISILHTGVSLGSAIKPSLSAFR